MDLRFRYQCGLRFDRSVPSISTLSRVFAELTTTGLAKRLLEYLVTCCKEEGIIDGSHVAIETVSIHAYEKEQPKRKSELTWNANWGAKFDSIGNKVKWSATSFILLSTLQASCLWSSRLHPLM